MKAKNNDKQKAAETCQSQKSTTCEKVGELKPSSAKNRASESNTANCNREEQCRESKKGQSRPEKSPGSEDFQPSESENRSVNGKKKNRKGQKNDLDSTSSGAPASKGSQSCGNHGAGPVDLSHIISNMYPMDYHSRLVFDASDIATAATALPSMSLAPYYRYVPSSQYRSAASGEDIDQVKATYLNSLQIFSDENANGCFIM